MHRSSEMWIVFVIACLLYVVWAYAGQTPPSDGEPNPWRED